MGKQIGFSSSGSRLDPAPVRIETGFGGATPGEALHIGSGPRLRYGSAVRGNAVAVVLLVLGVVSLLGVGLLSRSKVDVRFVAAHKSHESLFSLADGAGAMAFRWLAEHGATPEVWLPGKPNIQALADTTEYKTPMYVRKAHPSSGSIPTGTTEPWKGMYWPALSFLGIDTNPQRMPGYQIGKFETQYWIALGLVSTDRQATAGTAAGFTSALPPRAQASVQVAAAKIVKK